MALTKAEEAAVRGIIAIYQSKAPSLSADVAEIAVGLYDEWDGGGKAYTVGERVRSANKLYTCLQSHKSQADWAPTAAVSLWSANLAAADRTDAEEIPLWQQPDSTNGYKTGAVVMHDGKQWKSLVDANVWEPGVTGTESVWAAV